MSNSSDLDRELNELGSRDVFIHFLGAEGEGTDLPIPVSAAYLASVHILLEGWEADRQERDGEAIYGVSLQDIGTHNSLLAAEKVEFRVTIWVYLSLMAEASSNRLRAINASF
jgi:hypothetical protein